MSKFAVKKWNCDENLEQYVDSMLFDSDTNICSITVDNGEGITIDIDLCIRGDVSVTYKGEVYNTPSEFPEELKDMIRKNPGTFDVYAPSGEGNDVEEGDCGVNLNNWFELIFKINSPGDNNNDGFSDGDVYESDVSTMTPEQLKEELVEYAEEICEYYRLRETRAIACAVKAFHAQGDIAGSNSGGIEPLRNLLGGKGETLEDGSMKVYLKWNLPATCGLSDRQYHVTDHDKERESVYVFKNNTLKMEDGPLFNPEEVNLFGNQKYVDKFYNETGLNRTESEVFV